ncbi:MAG: helix-turn-helix domain-containing protein [Alphaproteobacteria bacterium]
MSRPDEKRPESKLAAQAAKTRARLIEATLELLPKYGFHKLSLDQVAAHVGMTKGAIYGHFENRDALILNALGSRPESRPDRMEWPKGREGSVKERMRKLGQAVLAARETAGPAAIAGLEFLLYAASNEHMKGFIAEAGRRGMAQMEENILGLFAPEELPMPVRSFAIMMQSMIPSLMYGKALSNDPPKDEDILAIFEGLAAGR